MPRSVLECWFVVVVVIVVVIVIVAVDVLVVVIVIVVIVIVHEKRFVPSVKHHHCLLKCERGHTHSLANTQAYYECKFRMNL